MRFAALMILGNVLLTGLAGAARARPAPPAAKPRPVPSVLALRIEPAAVLLSGAGSLQHVVVTARLADWSERDVTRFATLSLAPAGKAVLEPAAVLSPKADGMAQLCAAYGGKTAAAPVTVTGARHATPVSFANDVIPMLTKIGCNQGACHGAAAGQNGFKLSLRGFDPASDYDQIVKEANGRRVDRKHPEQSLVLLKPSNEVPHGGGLRLPKGSRARGILLRWLREGMPPPDGKVTLTGLVASPAERILNRPGETQQILVTASYSDGTRRDVTDMALYVSSDDGVAGVNDTGLVTARRGGESAIMVAYGGLVEAPRMIVPVGHTPVARAEFPPNNAIDDAVFAKLAQLRVHPSPLCTDQEFLRRASLDITGTLPSRQDAESFLRDRSPDKRARAIDRLLARPEYVDFRTLHLADLLRVNSQYLSEEGVECYYRWIHDQVRLNVPWNQFVKQLLEARGPNFQSGPANYYRVADSPADLAEATSQTFLGVRMQCAKCHNHPFERWTQNDYYGLAAFFAQVGRKGGPEFGEEQVVVHTGGEVINPNTRAVVAPKPLGDPAPVIPPGADRRVALADWLTAPANQSFARETVNRVWADFFGKGIVDPVDDVRVSNPPSNPPLLDLLARRFIAHNYDVKWLIRYITNSRTYQLSSRPTPTDGRDDRHFARALPRRLTAEQALDAVNSITGRLDRFGNRPPGTLAIQLTDSRVGNYFLEVFGKPKREILCACERDMQANLAQSLHLINSGDLNGKLASDAGRLHEEIHGGETDADIVTDLYLRALSRYPTAAEMKIALTHVRPPGVPPSAQQVRTALEDVAWAVLNSQEFLFNH